MGATGAIAAGRLGRGEADAQAFAIGRQARGDALRVRSLRERL